MDGELKQKAFSIPKLGFMEAFAAACAHRATMIKQLNSLGAGYTERHGTCSTQN